MRAPLAPPPQSPSPQQLAARERHRTVTITDIDIPFERLITIAFKAALAAIPAAIVFSFIVGALWLFIGAAIFRR